MLKIYLDHKFQWLQEGLNCEYLAYDVVNLIQINLEHDIIALVLILLILIKSKIKIKKNKPKQLSQKCDFIVLSQVNEISLTVNKFY